MHFFILFSNVSFLNVFFRDKMKDFRPAIIRMHFQQDGAPGHKAIETQAFLRANCPDFIKVDTHWRKADGEWPPNSPNPNPLDYAIWLIFEEKACSKPHPNVESLKRALKKAWDEIILEELIKIVDNFPKRLNAC